MPSIYPNSTYGKDCIHSIHSKIRTWNENAEGKLQPALKGIASIPAHLLTATLIAPALIVYDIAMAVLKGISSLTPLSTIRDAFEHLKSVPEVGKYMLISLLSSFPFHLGYKVEDAWNATLPEPNYDLPRIPSCPNFKIANEEQFFIPQTPVASMPRSPSCHEFSSFGNILPPPRQPATPEVPNMPNIPLPLPPVRPRIPGYDMPVRPIYNVPAYESPGVVFSNSPQRKFGIDL